jgi:hypothetical protein
MNVHRVCLYFFQSAYNFPLLAIIYFTRFNLKINVR